MMCSCVNNFLGDSSGTNDQESSPSIMSYDELPSSTEVNANNIIIPSLEELLKDHRQAYEAYKKVHEENELYDSLAKFKKVRQGSITPFGDISP